MLPGWQRHWRWHVRAQGRRAWGPQRAYRGLHSSERRQYRSGQVPAQRQSIVRSRWNGGDPRVAANRLRLSPDQRDHLGGEALQALEAVGEGIAAAVEDQFVHADRGEGTDVARDLVGGAGEAAPRAIAIGHAGVVERRFV